jgi:hypothetical protein
MPLDLLYSHLWSGVLIRVGVPVQVVGEVMRIM